MNKRMISFFTLIVFTVFTFSCYSTKVETIKKFANQAEGKIIALRKTTGERIEFLKGYPGRVLGNIIEGLVYKAGKTDLVSIPFSEVELVWVKRLHDSKSLALVFIGIPLVCLGVGVIIFALSDPFCPFIYSFDGEKYIFDAEPYAGAFCRGLKRTEWCGLKHLKEVKGEYRILVANEVDKAEYIDEMKLLVVDHPEGVRVVPDTLGDIHTISKPIVPVRAYDQKGNDLSSYVCENDRIYWQSQDAEKNPNRKEDLRDTLIFEFPKPKDASKAKLLFNGSNTLWAPQFIARYLELYGKRVVDWYDEMKRSGPAFLEMLSMYKREELFSLQIRVETDKGWESKGTILSAPPLTPKNKIYTLNLEDVPGDMLRIKLTPPAAFWKINYLAVDYSEDLPVNVTGIKALKATDNKGNEVGELLAANDNKYLVMPDIGDSVELIFQSPVRSGSMERTVILKAGGYYDVYLNAQGEPQQEILDRIHSEPGFALQYAFKEYLKWKKAGGHDE